MREKEEEYRLILKSLRLKSTSKRLAIFDILAHESAYLGPEEIWKKLKRRFKRIGLPTVYRNLEELSQEGVITKIIHPDRQLYYYFCRNTDHHHHFVCVSCRQIEDLHFCGAKEVKEDVERRLKGTVLSHILQVNGLCRKCSER